MLQRISTGQPVLLYHLHRGRVRTYTLEAHEQADGTRCSRSIVDEHPRSIPITILIIPHRRPLPNSTPRLFPLLRLLLQPRVPQRDCPNIHK
jgi:hypothetical protein